MPSEADCKASFTRHGTERNFCPDTKWVPLIAMRAFTQHGNGTGAVDGIRWRRQPLGSVNIDPRRRWVQSGAVNGAGAVAMSCK